MYWCSLFRTVFLLQLLSGLKLNKAAEGGSHSEWNPRREAMSAFREAAGLEKSCNATQPPPEKDLPRPTCKEAVGCDIPLNCYNYSSITISENATRAIKVTPRDLEGILENPSVTNSCAVVMFYAPWCPYSVDFAQRFNALGRTYKELPMLAVEFGETDM